MQVIAEFTISYASVICPVCNTPFATPLIARMPNISRSTVVEADLHRVLPDAAIRGALIAICPACVHTWWSTAFAPHYFVPDLLVPAPHIEYPKKFAHAVLTGRKNGEHPIDRALLALNGCWCARETYTEADKAKPEYKADNERWMVLAAQELEAALQDPEWNGNRSRYSYVMGEILRQLGDFHAAVRYFSQVDRRSMLPAELVERQRTLAISGNVEPVVLPPNMVEAIFMPKPPAWAQQQQPVTQSAVS